MHYRFTKPDVTLMLHIPRLVDNYSNILIIALRCFLDAFLHHFPSIREEWFANSITGPLELFISPKELKAWDAESKLISKNLCDIRVTSTIRFGYHKEKLIKIYANVQSSKFDNFSIINGERVVTITIPHDIWDKVYNSDFRNEILKLCYTLHATYACVDVSILCPRSIYGDSFYIWSGQSYDILEKEIYLPGIHWGLYVPYYMIESTGTIDYILSNLPCHYIQLIENEYFTGFWIEISALYCESSLNPRMQVRQFFQSSILDLSYKKMANHYSPIRELEYYYLPLNNQEWLKIQNGENDK